MNGEWVYCESCGQHICEIESPQFDELTHRCIECKFGLYCGACIVKLDDKLCRQHAAPYIAEEKQRAEIAA